MSRNTIQKFNSTKSTKHTYGMDAGETGKPIKMTVEKNCSLHQPNKELDG